MENSANAPLEKAPKLLEDLAQVPGVAWAVGGAMLLTLCGAMPVWAGVLAAVAAIIANNYLAAQARLREARARASAYANMAGPIVVASLNPEETPQEYSDRVAEWREKLRISGNPYADKIPIVRFPFSPMLYETGQLSIGWNIYLKLVAERQHLENLKWAESDCPAHLKTTFAMAVLPPPKKEFDND